MEIEIAVDAKKSEGKRNFQESSMDGLTKLSYFHVFEIPIGKLSFC